MKVNYSKILIFGNLLLLVGVWTEVLTEKYWNKNPSDD